MQMVNTVEIELRYEVLDSKKLGAFLKPLGRLDTRRDIDDYYDTPDARHFAQGLYIRVRNGKRLEIKFNRACLEDPTLPRQDFCEEHAFAIPLAEEDLDRLNRLLAGIGLGAVLSADFGQFLAVNDLAVSYTIDKMRTSYSYGNFTLALDEVQDLGQFLEIELMAQDTRELELVKGRMQDALAGLSLGPAFVGYATLMMRKKNFEQYLRGRFVSEEDRRQYLGK
jgi:adenylate cyclase class IV